MPTKTAPAIKSSPIITALNLKSADVVEAPPCGLVPLRVSAYERMLSCSLKAERTACYCTLPCLSAWAETSALVHLHTSRDM